MENDHIGWLGRLLPPTNTAGALERVRAGVGALFGLALTAMLTVMLLGESAAAPFLVAPMGASAVLLFCLPASPLAQPWSVIGGNTISALVGIACAQSIAAPMAAAPLACCLAIGAMFSLRCLHPPGGAVALTVVLAGPAVHDAGFGFAVFPIGLNAVLMVLAALLFNNLTGRRYPHPQQSVMQNVHETKDVVATARVGFSSEDLDVVLKRYGQVLDVSRGDLEDIILETEMQAYGRRFGVIRCADIMSRDVVTLDFATELDEAWRLLRLHKVGTLPVLNRARRLIGIVSVVDFLKRIDVGAYAALGAGMRRLLSRTPFVHSEKPEVVGQIMTERVHTVRDDTPIVELVPLMANLGVHQIPVVDAEDRFVGIITQSDLIGALYESRLSEAPVLAGAR
ncbi:HPP family protein [Massilia glaciei]|uniref:HPP family protein n=1 Tax=Massilia glaciei TaxID=1524097 RepID=A0A2U2HEV1_9BURK|nr:HPP family protein [Massilia glaciei]PWF42446.1 HPP family protein [Massilia glaciei]